MDVPRVFIYAPADAELARRLTPLEVESRSRQAVGLARGTSRARWRCVGLGLGVKFTANKFAISHKLVGSCDRMNYGWCTD